MPLDLQPRAWDTRRADKARRLARTAPLTSGKVLPTEKATEALEALLEPGDKVPVVLIAYGRCALNDASAGILCMSPTSRPLPCDGRVATATGVTCERRLHWRGPSRVA